MYYKFRSNAWKSWKQKTKYGLYVKYYVYLTCFHRWHGMNTLNELNFTLGKLPLNRVNRDDFPDLKTNFYTKITLENIILCRKCLSTLKAHYRYYMNKKYIHMLVKITKILIKMYFYMPPELSASFYTTSTQHKDILVPI